MKLNSLTIFIAFLLCVIIIKNYYNYKINKIVKQKNTKYVYMKDSKSWIKTGKIPNL